MKVKDLIEHLQAYPDDTEVCLSNDEWGTFQSQIYPRLETGVAIADDEYEPTRPSKQTDQVLVLWGWSDSEG